MRKIKVKNGDAVLVLGKDGNPPDLWLPAFEDNELVAQHIILVSAIAARMTVDPVFVRDCFDWFEKERAKDGKLFN